MTRRKKRAHLLGFIQHGVNSHATGMWRHSRDKVGYHFARPEYWQHMARTMERGLFDAMFIADGLAPYTTYQDTSDAIVRGAVPDARTVDHCANHHNRHDAPRGRRDSVHRVRAPVLHVPAALEPRSPVAGAGRVEHRELLLEE